MPRHPACQFNSSSTHVCPLLCALTGAKDVRKLEDQIKDLKTKVKEQEGTVAKLRAELAAFECKSELLVEKKALEVELEMRKKIEEAYDKGFKSCKDQFLALKELQSCL